MKAIYILIATTAVFISACKEKPEPQPDSAAPEAKIEATVTPALAVPDIFKVTLGKVFEGYSQIQSALAQDDSTKAKEALSSMHAMLIV